ncbi:MAG: hypothetical protein OCD00_12620 [Colwellia sp.]
MQSINSPIDPFTHNASFAVNQSKGAVKHEQIKLVEPVSRDGKQANTSSEPKVQRFDVDESAIAFFENNQLTKNDTAQSNTQTNTQSTFAQTASDHISSQNKTAVSAYKTVNNLAQRESVQQLFGVDLFA